jgi:preprotein translocase subunit YajC
MEYSLLIIMAVFLAFIVFSNKKRANAAKQLESSVTVGSNVMMLGGIKGKVVSVLEDTVIVETTPGTRIEFVKAAVRAVVAPSLEVAPKAVKPAASAKKPATATKKPAAAATKTVTKKTAK